MGDGGIFPFSKMTGTVKIRIAVMAALALCAPLAAQDRLAEDLAKYQHETDPVRKARALAKLGDEQVDLAAVLPTPATSATSLARLANGYAAWLDPGRVNRQHITVG